MRGFKKVSNSDGCNRIFMLGMKTGCNIGNVVYQFTKLPAIRENLISIFPGIGAVPGLWPQVSGPPRNPRNCPLISALFSAPLSILIYRASAMLICWCQWPEKEQSRPAVLSGYSIQSIPLFLNLPRNFVILLNQQFKPFHVKEQ
jgi:hypothetical protein